MYYSYDKLISYGAILNFVIGERGVGKSYNAIKWVVNDYLKHGNEFVYIRRYKTELETAIPKFFDALVDNGEFEGHDLRAKYNKKMSTFTCDGQTIGYAVALSTSNVLKSTSFAKVKTIIFDEFLLAEGNYHYLKNECETLLDICETIGRMRDVRVLLLGNAISVTNPYFTYFNLHLPYNSEYQLFKDNTILVNYIKNLEYREAKKQSRFGRLIAGTRYSDYAIDNEMLMDNKDFIRKKSPGAKMLAIIKIDGSKYGLWRDFGENLCFISKDYDPNCPNIFAVAYTDHDEKTVLANARHNAWLRLMIEAYKVGRLYFENMPIKNNVMPELVKCLTW